MMGKSILISGILSGNVPAGQTKGLAIYSPTEISETDFEKIENFMDTTPVISVISKLARNNFLIIPITSRAKL